MKISAFLVGVTLAGEAAPARGQASTTPVVSRWDRAALLGCYEILDSSRKPADGAWYNVMSLVRLTEIPMRRMDGAILPRSWHLRPLSDARHGRWKADPRGELEKVPSFAPRWSLNMSADSAAFDFQDGFSGASIEFAAAEERGDTLVGGVTEHWDFGPPFSNEKGRAYAVRRSCP